MRFLIAATLPPSTCGLVDRAHQPITPTDLGAHNLFDDTLNEVASNSGWLVVTENAGNVVHATPSVGRSINGGGLARGI